MNKDDKTYFEEQKDALFDLTKEVDGIDYDAAIAADGLCITKDGHVRTNP